MTAPPAPPVPERLRDALAHRYRLLHELGRGGMATVYLAEDLKHDRRVAIKVLRTELVSSDTEAHRFLREIRIAAKLSHPNVLPLLDSGTIAGAEGDRATPFFVMPYVAGESLRARLLREGQIPVDEAVRIAAAIGIALHYAHRENVLHRDIKPENVLLQEGQPVLADFGIARAISEAAAENVTARGLALGTPAYMSPEQTAADGTLDGRSDQYALACVLFEMLAGRPPFVADTVHGTLMRHLTSPAPGVRAFRSETPVGVERAVARALAKEPAERFGSLQDFVAALEAGLGDRGERAEQAPAPQPLSIAVLPFVNASPDPANEYLSDGITDELIGALAKVHGLQVASRTSVFAWKGRAVDVRTLGRELGVALVLEGTVRRSGPRLRLTVQLTRVEDGQVLWAERYDREARDVLAIEEEMAQTIVETLRAGYLGELSDPTPKRYTDNVTAYHLYLKGRFAWNKRTPEGVHEAIGYFREAIGADPGYALAYSGLSDAFALGVDYRAAPVGEGMASARAEAERALAIDDELAEAHTSLAWVSFIHDWDWAKAARHFARALELNPRYPTARQWHSWYLMAMGRIDDALVEGRLAQDLDPTSASIARSYGWLLTFARRPVLAIPQLRRAVLINPTSGETLWLLGQAYAQAGRYDEAEAALEEARAGAGEVTQPLAALGQLAVLRGRREEAEATLRGLLAAASRRYVSPVDVARLCIALGDRDAAFQWIDRAYAERRGWLVYLRVDPLHDPIRGDPRFRELLTRMKLS